MRELQKWPYTGLGAGPRGPMAFEVKAEADSDDELRFFAGHGGLSIEEALDYESEIDEIEKEADRQAGLKRATDAKRRHSGLAGFLAMSGIVAVAVVILALAIKAYQL